VLVVGITLVPMLIVLAASIPALVVMPFSRLGWQRMKELIDYFIRWTQTILTCSQAAYGFELLHQGGIDD
jgi:hypothetical protein